MNIENRHLILLEGGTVYFFRSLTSGYKNPYFKLWINREIKLQVKN